jgi:hypothetical protein
VHAASAVVATSASVAAAMGIPRVVVIADDDSLSITMR